MSDDYAHMSHQELFDLAHTGDPGRLFSAGDHWHRVSADMNDLHADLTRALGELAEQWQGAASNDFQQQGAMIADKINQAATRSQAMGDGLHQMGQALGDARSRMPEPPSGLEVAADKLVGGAAKGGIVGTLLGGPAGTIAGALGGKALDDHIKSQHNDAVHVMQTLGAQYTEASQKFGQDGSDEGPGGRYDMHHNLPMEPGNETPPSSDGATSPYSPYHAGSGSPGYQARGSAGRYVGEAGMHLAHEGYQPPGSGLPGGPTPPPGESGGGYPSPPNTGPYPLPPGDGGFIPPPGGSTRPGGGTPGPVRGGPPGDNPSGPGEPGRGGGLGGLDEGISGGHVSGGRSAAGLGADGISGGQPTGRMSATNPSESHGLGGNPTGGAPPGGAHEGEQGMPMAPGGMGGASGDGESKRGKRPAYLTEDPDTWKLTGPYNPAVIE